MARSNTEALSLVVRSADNHLRLFKPSALKEKPYLYAGKVESTILTLLLDIFSVDAQDVPNGPALYRACSAFHQQWRAYDEVIDVFHPTTDTKVTEYELDNTAVYHPYAMRNVTGLEARLVAKKASLQAIPGNDASAVKRRDSFNDLLLAYQRQAAETANNPRYHNGEYLDYSTALQAKTELTGFLGTVGASLVALSLNRQDQDSIEFFSGVILLMQYGDDLLDWRKDMLEHEKIQQQSKGAVRPIENLLVATLAENPNEMRDCRAHLADRSQRAFLCLQEFAPKTWDNFQGRFKTQLDKLPRHKKEATTKDIMELTFYKIMPKAPESGWFYRWAKY